MSDVPKCQMASWVKGVGEKPCRNKAKMVGYYSEQDSRLVCGRHATIDFRYFGPLDTNAKVDPDIAPEYSFAKAERGVYTNRAKVDAEGDPIRPDPHSPDWYEGYAEAQREFESARRAWLIVFEDPDHGNEMYGGVGARDAAYRRFEEASSSWNATLFASVEDNYSVPWNERTYRDTGVVWSSEQHRKDAVLVQAAMQRIAERRARGIVYVPLDDASDLLMALHHEGIYRPSASGPLVKAVKAWKADVERNNSDPEVGLFDGPYPAAVQAVFDALAAEQ